MSGSSRKKVLVVDDSPFQRARTSEILTEAGHDVVVCANGEEAMGILTRDHSELDLLLTDLDMPRMSGFELLEWFREQPFSERILTLVLTGAYDLTDVVNTLRILRVNGVLVKGGNPHHILSRVNSILFPEILERRKHDRVSVNIPVVYVREGEHFDAVLTNISLGGCFLLSSQLARAKEQIDILVTLPVDDKKIKLTGGVNWVIGGDEWQGKRRSIEGMGVQWIAIPGDDRLLLEVFIEEKLKEERLYDMLSP